MPPFFRERQDPRTRRNFIESVLISWLLPLLLTRMASLLLSISTYSTDFKTDVQNFIASTPEFMNLIDNTIALANNPPHASTPTDAKTGIRSSLFDKVQQIIQSELQRKSFKIPEWLSKTVTLFIVLIYACSKAMYFTFAMIFTLLCLGLTMRRKMGGVGAFISVVIGGPQEHGEDESPQDTVQDWD